MIHRVIMLPVLSLSLSNVATAMIGSPVNIEGPSYSVTPLLCAARCSASRRATIAAVSFCLRAAFDLRDARAFSIC